jgi:hypothetical protein
MVEIAVLPINDAAVPQGLFAADGCAEGTLSWFRTLAATTLAAQEHAAVAMLMRDGMAAAALPIVQTRNGARALTAPYTTRYAPALPLGDAAWELGRAARIYASGVLRLDGMDPSDPGSVAFLSGLQESGLAVLQYEGFANWYEPVLAFDRYWSARSSRLRTTVRRKLAAATKSGVEFLIFRDHFDRALAVYDEIYCSSWKTPEPYPAFMSDMVNSLGAAGLVRMGVMSVAARAVAAQIWLLSGERGTIFKLAHREDAADHSPGTLLTFWMAKTLVEEEGLREIDFGRGDDPYKRDWLSQRRTRIGIVAADWRSSAGLAAIVRDIVPALGARAVRKHLQTNRRYSAAAASTSGVVVSGFPALYRGATPSGLPDDAER